MTTTKNKQQQSDDDRRRNDNNQKKEVEELDCSLPIYISYLRLTLLLQVEGQLQTSRFVAGTKKG